MKSISVYVSKSEGWINVMRFAISNNDTSLLECKLENYTVERFTYWLNQVRERPTEVYMFECSRIE